MEKLVIIVSSHIITYHKLKRLTIVFSGPWAIGISRYNKMQLTEK